MNEPSCRGFVENLLRLEHLSIGLKSCLTLELEYISSLDLIRPDLTVMVDWA